MQRARGGEREKGAQLGSVALKEGSRWVIAPVCLLLALSMGTMCAQICPRFAGRTVSSGALVLVSLELKESSAALLTINTEKSVMASMLLRDLKQALTQA
eukprot:superscaffoldBa00005930_g20948